MSRLFKTVVLLAVIAGAVQAQAPVIIGNNQQRERGSAGASQFGHRPGIDFRDLRTEHGAVQPAAIYGRSSAAHHSWRSQRIVHGGGVTASAPLFYVYSGQIAGILRLTYRLAPQL